MKSKLFIGLGLMGLAMFAYADQSPTVADADAAGLYGGQCAGAQNGACGTSGGNPVHLPVCTNSSCSGLTGYVTGNAVQGDGTGGASCGGACGTIATGYTAGCGA